MKLIAITLLALAIVVSADGEIQHDDNPRIDPEEIIEPKRDYNDWGTSPPWTLYEDAASVDCRIAKMWCERDAKLNSTAVR